MQATRSKRGLLLILALAASGGLAGAGDLAVDNLTVNQTASFYGVVQCGTWTETANNQTLAYSFTSNATPVPDESGNGNTGTVSGATWTNTGKVGSCYDFDGNNDSIATSGTNTLNATNQVTIAAWVYFKGEGIYNHWVVMKGRSTTDGQYAIGRFYSGSGNSHKFVVSIAAGAWTDYVSDTVLNDNTWYHLAGTYDRTNVNFYINGVLTKSTAETDAILGGTGVLCVGRSVGGTEFCNARIDQVRVYDRALSTAEIQGLYGASLSATGGEIRVTTLSVSNSVQQGQSAGTNYFMGKVGIGTNNPTERLHVDGNIRVESNLTVVGGVTGGSYAGNGAGLTSVDAATLGGHAAAYFATGTPVYAESDPEFAASAAHGIGAANTSNWTTAYGWGDHAAAGYATGTPLYVEADPVWGGVSNEYLRSNTADSLYVSLAGDTMTGLLALPVNGLTLGADQMVATGGKIGIGTNAPSRKFQVEGDAKITGLALLLQACGQAQGDVSMGIYTNGEPQW